MERLRLLSLLLTLLIVPQVWAGQKQNPHTGRPDLCISVREEDGDPAMVACQPLEVTNGTLTDDGDGAFSLNIAGASAAPTDATYVTLSTNGTLTDERVLTPGTALDTADGGAGSTITVSLDTTEINDTTFGDNTETILWTFDPTGTNPTLEAAPNALFTATGTVRISNQLELGGVLGCSGALQTTSFGRVFCGAAGSGSGDLTDILEGLAIDVTDPGGPQPTVAVDPTELSGSRTFGDASTDTIVWTWDRQTGTDPTLTANSGELRLLPKVETPNLNTIRIIDGTTYPANGSGIQFALDDLRTTGGLVLIPEGTYTVTGSIKIFSHQTLQGAGRNTILRNGTNADAPVITDGWTTTVGAVLTQLYVDGNGTNQSTAFSTIDLDDCQQCQLTHLWVTGGLRTGTYPTVSSDGEGIVLRNSEHNLLDTIYAFSNAYDGVKLRNSDYNTLTNINCLDNGRQCVQISYQTSNANPSDYNVVNGVTVEHTTGTPHASSPATGGIFIHSGSNNSVTNFSVTGPNTCVGGSENMDDNVFAGGVCAVRGTASAGACISVDDTSAGTDSERNIFADILCRPIAGSANAYVNLDRADHNRLQNLRMARTGSATGNWTVTIASDSDSNVFLQNWAENVSLADSGTNTKFFGNVGFSEGTYSHNDWSLGDGTDTSLELTGNTSASSDPILSFAPNALVTVTGTTRISSQLELGGVTSCSGALQTNAFGRVICGTAGAGTITEVVAGAGLTGGGSSGSVTVDVGAGTAIDVNANDVAWDSTEVNDTTWGDGTEAEIVWTPNTTGSTEATLAYAPNALATVTGTLRVSSQLEVGPLTASDCDVKSTTYGRLFCGTDATGAGGGDPILIDGAAISDASGVDLQGGVGIDWTLTTGVSPDTASAAVDATELTNITFSDGATTAPVWTFDPAGGNPTLTYANNAITFNALTTVTGSAIVTQGLTLGNNSTRVDQTFDVNGLDPLLSGESQTLTYNVDNNDLDFRIKGDNATSLFFTDANTDQIEFDLDTVRVSEADAIWDGFIVRGTATVTGNTQIQTTSGFNPIDLQTMTISAETAGLVIDQAATLHIQGAPVAGGTNPPTITNRYALWVAAGDVRFNSDDLFLGEGSFSELRVTPNTSGSDGVLSFAPNALTTVTGTMRISQQLELGGIISCSGVLQTNAVGRVICGTAGAGTVTSVDSGDGLTGGPITGSGTLAVGAGTALDVSADAVSWDSTEVNDTTWGDASDSELVWTPNSSGAADATLAFAPNALATVTGTLRVSSQMELGAVPSCTGSLQTTSFGRVFCGSGSTAWDTIGDPSGDGNVAFGATQQILSGNTADTAAAQDLLSLNFTNDASSDSATQRILVLNNNSATGGTMEDALVIDNKDDSALTRGIRILGSSTGAITTAIDASDAELGTALAIGGNDITSSSGAQVQFASATSLSVPQGTGPTVDGAGELAVDTTDDQLIYYGSAKRVVPHTFTRCAAIEDLTASDDYKSLGSWGDGVTITSVWCYNYGTATTTTGTIQLSDGGRRDMTHTTPTCAIPDNTATAQSVTAANSLTATEELAFRVTNTPAPTTDDYTICVTGTWDAQ